MPMLENRLALVTGASGGLGARIAAGLAAEGARVILADLDLEGARRIARDLAGDALAYALDVTDRASVNEFARHVGRMHGNLDILVNSAGRSGRTRFDDPALPDIWDRILSVNLQGTFNVAHAFVPALKATHGTIINLASVASFVSTPSTAAYVVSKGAVRSLTQALARELGPFGIRVNAVAPGVMETNMTADLRASPESIAWYMGRVPLARCGAANEVVGPTVFLASDMASYVNGAVLPVDGGFLAV